MFQADQGVTVLGNFQCLSFLLILKIVVQRPKALVLCG